VPTATKTAESEMKIGTKARIKQNQNIYCVLFLLFFKVIKHVQCYALDESSKGDSNNSGSGGGATDAAAILQLFFSKISIFRHILV